MKTDLENFPKPIDGRPTVDELKYIEWVENFKCELENKLIKVEKLRDPDQILTMTKRKLCEDFNREIMEIMGK